MITCNNQKTPRNAFKRAFTLMESAIVLGVIGIVLAGIWLYSGTVSNKESMQVAVNQVWQIANNVRDMYAGRSDLAVNNSDQMNKHVCAGLFPRSMLVGTTSNGCAIAGQPRNPWGGAVALAFSKPPINGIQTAVFDIDFTFTKSAAQNRPNCVDFLSHFLTSGGGGTAVDDQRAGGGPVNSYLLLPGPVSVLGKNPSEIAGLAPNGCTGVRLRFKL